MTRILVIDDSALMRRKIAQILEAEGWAVETARKGAQALEMVPSLKPDVITLDINMPEMDGLTFLAHLMEIRPTPVVMVSSLTTEGALATFEALELGAVDYVPKPDGTVSLSMEAVAGMLCEKVAAASRARIRRQGRMIAAPAPKSAPPPVTRGAVRAPAPASKAAPSLDRATLPGRPKLLLIGASTGGPRTVETVLAGLPADFPLPIMLCQHMPATFTSTFARRLADNIRLDVVEVGSPTPIVPGRVIVGRGDADLILTRRAGTLTATSVPADPSRPWHPSVGRMVASAAELIPPREILAVMLTGMGDDGAREMTSLARAGGRTIAEAEETCVVWGMPRALAEAGGAEVVLPCQDIAQRIVTWAQGASRAV